MSTTTTTTTTTTVPVIEGEATVAPTKAAPTKRAPRKRKPKAVTPVTPVTPVADGEVVLEELTRVESIDPFDDEGDIEVTEIGVPVPSPQDATLRAIAVSSRLLETAGEEIISQANGLETVFQRFLGDLRAARSANVSFAEISSAMSAAESEDGEERKPHQFRSVGALSEIEPVLDLLALEGDLPDGWVFRTDSAAPLGKDVASVTRLVVRAIRPGESIVRVLKGLEDDAAPAYGKAAVKSIISAASSKAEAIQALEGLVSDVKTQVAQARTSLREEKEAEEARVITVSEYLLAASTQIDNAMEPDRNLGVGAEGLALDLIAKINALIATF